MYKKTVLKNGLRLVLVPMKNSQTVTVSVLFGAGSKFETKNINGISHFLEHMFFKGTKKRPSTMDIAEVLDRVGGEYNAFTSKEFTGYWAKVSNGHLELALDWVSDILLNSVFNESEMERERGVIKEEINMYLDNPMRNVGNIWEELLYGDQPAGWQISGTKDTVSRISRPELVDFFKSHYQSGNAVICIAGNFKQDVVKQVMKYFGKLSPGEGGKKLPVKEIQVEPGVRILKKDTDQTHFCIGARAYDLFHKDRYALTLLATLLGGMMSSRLFISVREKKGLAYYIRTCAEKYSDTGYLMTQAGVGNDKVEEAVKEIMKEYALLRDKKVGDGELKKAKENLRGATMIGLETSDELASWFSTQEITKKETLTPQQAFAKIEAVRASDLQRVARDIFSPEKMNLALIGPYEDEEPLKNLLKI